MAKKNMDETEMTVEQGGEDQAIPAEPVQQEKETPAAKQGSTLDKLRLDVSEDDNAPVGSLSLKTVLGGDILTGMLRRQVWLIMLIVAFVTVYVASRYQCQQDMLDIDKLEHDLVDAKYKALSSTSNLTEQCRESHVLKALKNNQDSLLKPSDQPPYIIYIE